MYAYSWGTGFAGTWMTPVFHKAVDIEYKIVLK